MDITAMTPDMDLHISLGDFHRTHDQAQAVEERLKNEDLTTVPSPRLVQDLQLLTRGQFLTDHEDGPDLMYSHSYDEAIKLVEEELGRRAPSVAHREKEKCGFCHLYTENSCPSLSIAILCSNYPPIR